MQFTNVIWDFDGTLFDSYPHMTESMILGLRDLKIEEEYEKVLKLMKVNVTCAVNSLESQYHIEGKLHSQYKYYETGNTKTVVSPYQGAKQLLEEIIAKGGINYIYTHRDRGARDYLKQYHMDSLFYDMITGNDGFPLKPAPDALNYLISKYKLEASETVIVGDRNCDIDAGINAGISGILFDPGHFYDWYQTKYRAYSIKQLGAIIFAEEGNISIEKSCNGE